MCGLTRTPSLPARRISVGERVGASCVHSVVSAPEKSQQVVIEPQVVVFCGD